MNKKNFKHNGKHDHKHDHERKCEHDLKCDHKHNHKPDHTHALRTTYKCNCTRDLRTWSHSWSCLRSHSWSCLQLCMLLITFIITLTLVLIIFLMIFFAISIVKLCCYSKGCSHEKTWSKRQQNSITNFLNPKAWLRKITWLHNLLKNPFNVVLDTCSFANVVHQPLSTWKSSSPENMSARPSPLSWFSSLFSKLIFNSA